jgi:CHRD domain
MSVILKRGSVALAVLLLAGCTSNQTMHSSPAAATTRSFSATMTAGQEVPPNASPGTGSASVTLDPDGTLHWTVSYQNLTGPATAAHFHGPAMPGMNAGVVVNIGGTAPANPMQGTAHLNTTQVADLVAGRWYVNVHTTANPNGEIRGQVVAAP